METLKTLETLKTDKDKLDFLVHLNNCKIKHGKFKGDELKFYVGYFTKLGYSIDEIIGILGTSRSSVSNKRKDLYESGVLTIIK